VEQVCERVIVINKGVKVYDDALGSLVSKYEKSRYVRFVFEEEIDAKALAKLGNLIEVHKDYYLFKVTPGEMVELITRVSKKFGLADLQVESVPLENIIEEIFKRN